MAAKSNFRSGPTSLSVTGPMGGREYVWIGAQRHATDSVGAFLQGGTGIYGENQIRQLVNNAYAELRVHRMEDHLVAYMQKSLVQVLPILKRALRQLVADGYLEDIPADPTRMILQHIKRYRIIHTHKTTFGAYLIEGTLYVERPYLGLHMREEILFHELLEACGVSHFQTVKLTQEYLWDALLPDKEYVVADTNRIPDERDDADAVIDEIYTPREAAMESAGADVARAQKDIELGRAYNLPSQSNQAQEHFHNKFCGSA